MKVVFEVIGGGTMPRLEFVQGVLVGDLETGRPIVPTVEGDSFVVPLFPLSAEAFIKIGQIIDSKKRSCEGAYVVIKEQPFDDESPGGLFSKFCTIGIAVFP